MRNFIAALLFLIFGSAFGLDTVFSKLKNVNNETVVIFNCENILFSYLDAAFSLKNKGMWANFSQKRYRLDREKNLKIDKALFFAPRRIMDMRYKQDFKDIQDRGANIIFVYQINKDRMLFSKEHLMDIRFSTLNFLSELGLNPKRSETSRAPNHNTQPIEKSEHSINFEDGLLITDSKNISEDISAILAELSKSKSIKKVIVIHDGTLKFGASEKNSSTEEITFQPQESTTSITKDQIKRQLEILEESGEWMDDAQIQRISNLSDEEAVFEICKQSIMDVCPCKEIIEKEIYAKICSIVKDKDSIKDLEEIIDYFQEIYNSLPSVIHYVNRVYFWRVCSSLGLEEQKAVEMLKKIDRFYFNEHEVREVPYKVLRRIGCGIHWRDMAKYHYVKNFVMTEKEISKTEDSHRYKTYSKILGIVFERVNRDMKQILEESRDNFIRILIEHNIETKKILSIFKISEEILKNIIDAKALKKREIDVRN